MKKETEFKPSSNLHRKSHGNLLPPADFGARLFKNQTSKPDNEINSSNTSRRRAFTDQDGLDSEETSKAAETEDKKRDKKLQFKLNKLVPAMPQRRMSFD